MNLLHRVAWDDSNVFEGFDENEINQMLEDFADKYGQKIYNGIVTKMFQYIRQTEGTWKNFDSTKTYAE